MNKREFVKAHTQEEAMQPKAYHGHRANQLDHEESTINNINTPQLTARINSDDEAHLASSLISSIPVTTARNTIEQIVLEEEERLQTPSNLSDPDIEGSSRERVTSPPRSSYFSSHQHAFKVGLRIKKLRKLNEKRQISNYIATAREYSKGNDVMLYSGKFEPICLKKVADIETAPKQGMSIFHQKG
jgi:hypothetical protein